MNDVILTHAQDLMSSPWVYAALLVLATFDALFPVFPSETLVIVAGSFAAVGSPDLWLVIIAAAFGAAIGDHVSYAVGRCAGAGLLRRLRPGSKGHSAYVRVSGSLAERGGLVLVAARYIPGARTVTTLTLGTVGYPLRTFTGFTVLATVLWSGYFGLIGYAGGSLFDDRPLLAIAVGIGVALTIAAAAETVRCVIRRRASRTSASAFAPITAEQGVSR